MLNMLMSNKSLKIVKLFGLKLADEKILEFLSAFGQHPKLETVHLKNATLDCSEEHLLRNYGKGIIQMGK